MQFPEGLENTPFTANIFIFRELVKNGSYRGHKNKFMNIEPDIYFSDK